ncbi:Stromelysin-2 [Manis javanica]|nr:Stromelysin-2 [Manis javanica]
MIAQSFRSSTLRPDSRLQAGLIMDYMPDLPKDAVDSAIETALRTWEEVTPHPLSRIHEGQADIMISFAVKAQFIPIAAPELRHSLGFFDLANMEDLMYAPHKAFTDLAQFCLPQDVNGIQSLYE